MCSVHAKASKALWTLRVVRRVTRKGARGAVAGQEAIMAKAFKEEQDGQGTDCGWGGKFNRADGLPGSAWKSPAGAGDCDVKRSDCLTSRLAGVAGCADSGELLSGFLLRDLFRSFLLGCSGCFSRFGGLGRLCRFGRLFLGYRGCSSCWCGHGGGCCRCGCSGHGGCGCGCGHGGGCLCKCTCSEQTSHQDSEEFFHICRFQCEQEGAAENLRGPGGDDSSDHLCGEGSGAKFFSLE